MKILFLPGSYNSPPARFRVWQFVEPLKALGHEVIVRVTTPERSSASPSSIKRIKQMSSWIDSMRRASNALWLLRDAEEFDVIFMNRDVVPESNIRFIEPWLSKRNSHLIFDFDDAIHLGAREQKLRYILPYFAWVTPGNEYLASFARQVHTQVSIWPTVVNTDYYQPLVKREAGPIRIGWSGSRSTLQYCLPLLKSVITNLAKTEVFEFIVIADIPPQINWSGVEIRYIPWTPETEVPGLQKIDIGLMPLEDKLFERGKCGLKAIQYMGVGIPALVSPVGVNREIVIHGETGFHCQNEEEWLKYLKFLLGNDSLRQLMGSSARERITKNYSVTSLLPQMLEVFENVSKM